MTYHYTTNYFQDFRISNLRYIDKNIFIRNKIAEQTVYSNSYHEHENLRLKLKIAMGKRSLGTILGTKRSQLGPQCGATALKAKLCW